MIFSSFTAYSWCELDLNLSKYHYLSPKFLPWTFFYCLIGNTNLCFFFFFFGNGIFGMPGETMIPSKKNMQDTADKGILLILETSVLMPVYKLAATYEDSASVMAKSTGCSISGNNNIDDRTPKTNSWDSLCQFGINESNIAIYVRPLP